jgi:PAS domain S-box-containing protein
MKDENSIQAQTMREQEKIPISICSLALGLKNSTEFPSCVAAALSAIESAGLSLSALSIYLMGEDPHQATDYVLQPAPVGWETVSLSEESVEVQVHATGKPRVWKGTSASPSSWQLTLPTALGGITISNFREEGFSPDEQTFLEQLACPLEMLVLRHRDLHALEMIKAQIVQVDTDWMALYNGSFKLSGENQDEVIQKIIKTAMALLSYDRVGIFLREDDLLRGAWGVDEKGEIVPIPNTVFPLYPDPPGEMAEAALIARGEREYFLTSDLDGEGRESLEGDIQANVSVPMRVGNQIMGVLAADNYFTNRPIIKEQVTPLMILANQGAIALENARLYEESHRINESLQQELLARRQSEEKYRTLFETMGQGVFYQDANGGVISANPAAERILGLTADQMHSRTSNDPRWRPIHEDGSDFPGETHPSMTAIKTGEVVTDVVMGVFNPDEEAYRWILINAVPQFKKGEDKPYQVYTTFNDITERKQMENLLSIQRDLATALNATPLLDEGLHLCLEAALQVSEMECGGVYLVDDTSGALHLAFHQGLSAGFVKEISHFDADSTHAQMIMAGTPIYTQHKDLNVSRDEIRRKEGLRAIAIVPICHQDCVIACVNIASSTFDEVPAAARRALEAIAAQIGSAISRLKAEKYLQESEERYRDLVKNANDLIYTHDLEGNFISGNTATSQLYGYSPEEILRVNITQIVDPEFLSLARQKIREKMEGRLQAEPYELLTYSRAGTPIWVEVNTRLLERGGKPMIMGIARDITDRKMLEQQREQALQADRLQALGEMAAGVAHELNQPLHGIRMFAEGILYGLRNDMDIPKEEVMETFEEIIPQVDRMATIIDHMRIFARDQAEEEAVPFEVKKVIEDTLKLIGAQLKVHNVEMRVEIGDDLPECQGWPYQLEQVFLNMLSNARDALDERQAQMGIGGGEGEEGWKPVLEIRAGREDDPAWVRIEVADTGGGIPEKVLPRIFDPFFTTKEVGKGTGLGLALSQGIVEQHGGSLEVDNQPGKGATFAIRLPIRGKKKMGHGIGFG